MRRAECEPPSTENLDVPDAPTDVISQMVLETRLDCLKSLAALMLDELNSLQRLRSNRDWPLILTREVQRFEAQLVRNALRISSGVERRAATILGIHPATLREKIERLGIQIADSNLDSEAVRTAPQDLPREWPVSFNAARVRFEVSLIERALEETGGSQRKAAKLLEIPITTLNWKIQKHRIDPQRFSPKRSSTLVCRSYNSSPQTDNRS